MTARFIVGYDASPAADSAEEVTLALAAALGGEAVAVHAYSPPVPVSPNPFFPAPVVAPAESERAACEAAERVLARARSGDRIAVAGPSAQVLHTMARDQRAVLIALGLTHRRGLTRILPGSVGERVLHGAPCPLLVVPADASRTIRRIAAGIDDGEPSHRARRVAEALAARLGAQLLTLRAPDGAGPSLVTMCAEAGVDLLVVGSRARARALDGVLGSTSRHLIDHAPCAVLVVTGTVPAALLEGAPTSGVALG